jgi:glycosyltransferase involved in cell wall biosynthesis
MRVLVTLPWGERLGGAEELLQVVLEGARDSGHEIEPVFLRGGPWATELSELGLRVGVIESGRLREAHRWLATVVRLARLFRRRRPDLIVNWSPKTQLYGSPAALLAGMRDRVIWWQQGLPERPAWIDRAATALPAIAVGCYCRAAAEAQERISPARRTIVWYPGTRAAAPAAGREGPLELPQGVPIVGLVGRLQPWKGQDRLLRAQAILRERGRDMHLVLVGGDAYGLSPEYAASLPQLVRSLGLESAVTLTGQVPDAGPYMEQMDVLVNASDPEPFGAVLIEAMARSVAVVAVDSGGPAEFIEHGRTGVLASSGEPGALADALEPLLASEEMRNSLARAGHELFERDFTEVAMRRRWFSSLEALAAGHRRNGAAPCD